MAQVRVVPPGEATQLADAEGKGTTSSSPILLSWPQLEGLTIEGILDIV